MIIVKRLSSTTGHLEVDPVGEDVGDKSIGGLPNGKRYGNHVPEFQVMNTKNNNNDQPDDGEDSGVPGDARELLFLAHQLHTGEYLEEFKKREPDLMVKAMR